MADVATIEGVEASVPPCRTCGSELRIETRDNGDGTHDGWFVCPNGHDQGA